MAMILVNVQIKYYEAAIVICLFDEFSGHTILYVMPFLFGNDNNLFGGLKWLSLNFCFILFLE